MAVAKASTRSTLIRGNPLLDTPDAAGWWDLPDAEVSTLPSTQAARAAYLDERVRQRPLLG